MYCISKLFNSFGIRYIGGIMMFKENQAKSKTIGIRVRPEEHAFIKKVATDSGYKNISEYVLELIKTDIENRK